MLNIRCRSWVSHEVWSILFVAYDLSPSNIQSSYPRRSVHRSSSSRGKPWFCECPVPFWEHTRTPEVGHRVSYNPRVRTVDDLIVSRNTYFTRDPFSLVNREEGCPDDEVGTIYPVWVPGIWGYIRSYMNHGPSFHPISERGWVYTRNGPDIRKRWRSSLIFWGWCRLGSPLPVVTYPTEGVECVRSVTRPVSHCLKEPTFCLSLRPVPLHSSHRLPDLGFSVPPQFSVLVCFRFWGSRTVDETIG